MIPKHRSKKTPYKKTSYEKGHYNGKRAYRDDIRGYMNMLAARITFIEKRLDKIDNDIIDLYNAVGYNRKGG